MGRGIQAGRVWTNCYHAYPAHAAFGGYKQSGIGRENHKMMLDHYQQTKNLLVSYSQNALGLLLMGPHRWLTGLRRDAPPARACHRRRRTCSAASAMHGPLMFHQSGGCCDGSSPMCYPAGEFIVGDRDVLLGVLDLRLGGRGPPGRTGRRRRRAGLDLLVAVRGVERTQLVLDVVPGRGSGFSLETPEGKRFLSRARAFTADENDALATAGALTGADWENGQRPAATAVPVVVAEAVDACPVPTRHR